MIEVAATNIDATKRLFEALENSRLPAGDGKVSDTRGPVPHELAEQFRMLMEQPDATHLEQSAATNRTDAPQRIDAQTTVEHSDLAADKVNSVDSGLGEGQAVEFLTPEALLQQQFSVSMTIFESKYFSQMQSQATSNLEQRLKSQEG